MPNEAMAVFGYARVSTDSQLENYSIEEQQERLRAFCAAKGWTLRKIYVDGGYSGGNTDRPALQQMLSAIRRGGVGAVVVYKLDRLSRSQKDTLTLIEDEFLANGTDFVSINENFDTSSPFGRAMIGILSVFAQLEKDQITERFTMGRIGRSKAGYFHGGGNAPTGYDYIDGLLQVNEYQAMQVRDAFDMFLQGKSINAISRALNIKYSAKWNASRTLQVLRNSLYIGKVHFRGQEYQGLHTPLISEETFTETSRQLTSFDRESRKNCAQRNPFRAGYLLSGLVYCQHCGARYSANHGYYKCYSRAKSSQKFIVDPNCKNDNWEIPRLDSVVTSQIDMLLMDSATLDRALSQVEQASEAKVDVDKVKKRLSEIDGQIEKLIELYQVSGIPMESLSGRIAALSAERDVLQETLSDNGDDARSRRERFLTALQAYAKGFDELPLDSRRAILASIVRKVIIDGQSVHFEWNI